MFEKCMRVCPFCKAEISDFDSQCEYCGKEIPLAPECETILQDAEFVLQKAENAVNENSGGSKKIKDVMESVARKIDFLKQFEDVKKIKKLLNGLVQNQELLEQKFISIRKKEKRRAIIFSIFAEISIFLFLFLASNFEAESVETFIYGFFGFIFVVIGIALSKNFWIGLVAGALMAALLFWCVTSFIGKILLVLIWTISIIIFDVIAMGDID